MEAKSAITCVCEEAAAVRSVEVVPSCCPITPAQLLFRAIGLAWRVAAKQDRIPGI